MKLAERGQPVHIQNEFRVIFAAHDLNILWKMYHVSFAHVISILCVTESVAVVRIDSRMLKMNCVKWNFILMNAETKICARCRSARDINNNWLSVYLVNVKKNRARTMCTSHFPQFPFRFHMGEPYFSCLISVLGFSQHRMSDTDYVSANFALIHISSAPHISRGISARNLRLSKLFWYYLVDSCHAVCYIHYRPL